MTAAAEPQAVQDIRSSWVQRPSCACAGTRGRPVDASRWNAAGSRGCQPGNALNAYHRRRGRRARRKNGSGWSMGSAAPHGPARTTHFESHCLTQPSGKGRLRRAIRPCSSPRVPSSLVCVRRAAHGVGSRSRSAVERRSHDAVFPALLPAPWTAFSQLADKSPSQAGPEIVPVVSHPKRTHAGRGSELATTIESLTSESRDL